MPQKEQTIKRETTSIKIKPDLWKEAKIQAIKDDIDLSELVEKAIERWIKEQKELNKK
jgi:post-segregation antitoxin (ccd killing protein)